MHIMKVNCNKQDVSFLRCVSLCVCVESEKNPKSSYILRIFELLIHMREYDAQILLRRRQALPQFHGKVVVAISERPLDGNVALPTRLHDVKAGPGETVRDGEKEDREQKRDFVCSYVAPSCILGA